MATLDFTRYFLYRWRYIIGYTAVCLLLASLLVFAGLFVPGGLSKAEELSVVQSASISYTDLSSLATLNLPYHMLQDVILKIFGPSVFAVKLPSLILALLTAVGFIALLRKWFKPNIAVLASLITISASQFLFIAQQGTPDILYVFWPVAILLLGTQITRSEKKRALWKVVFGITVALSLYTPLSFYTLLSVAVTISLHPHLRAIIRRMSAKRILISAAAMLAFLAPLIISLVREPHHLSTLLGIPTNTPDLGHNISTVLQQYFFFWDAGATSLATPIFSLGSFIIIGLGVYRLARTLNTTRSYLILTWICCLLPVLFINPEIASVVFAPVILLIAAGLTSLIDYWYRLFPRNPYARVGGLIPVIILVTALIGSGVARYFYGYHYNPVVSSLFSYDLKLIPGETKQLVVSNDETSFYNAIMSYQSSIEVVASPSQETFTATRLANKKSFDGYSVVDIKTNSYSNEADRFYVYKKN